MYQLVPIVIDQMGLTDDLHEMQNAEIFVSAKSQNELEEPFRGDGMTVAYQGRYELCPCNDLLPVEASLVLTKLDGPFAARRVHEVREVVGHGALRPPIDQADCFSFVSLKHLSCSEWAS